MRALVVLVVLVCSVAFGFGTVLAALVVFGGP